MQLHRTGIGASYGRWYERTASAAAGIINDEGGINGRPLELVIEDDGTDPRRGAEVIEKFATLHKMDVAYGTLFSHVVIGSSPRAGELKLPYFVVSEGHHVAIGQSESLCIPARNNRCQIPGYLHGALGVRKSGQEGHYDLPGLCLRS